MAEEKRSICPKCGFSGDNPIECLKCGVVFAKYPGLVEHAAAGSLPAPVPAPEENAGEELARLRKRYGRQVIPHSDDGVIRSDRFEFDDPRIHAAALPAAFGFAILVKILFLPALLLDYFRVWIHEFGHAVISWCGSHRATPLALAPGFGWTNWNEEKSTVVYVCFLFLLGVMGYKGYRLRTWILVGIAAALFSLQTFFTFIASANFSDMIRTYSGVGGEFYLSALLIIAFYYKLPDRARWDFFRFLFLAIGMYVFVDVFYLWLRIVHDDSLIPWGTCIWGSTDANGDLNKLRDLHDWSKTTMVRTYLMTGIVCGVIIVVHYVVFLLKDLRKKVS